MLCAPNRSGKFTRSTAINGLTYKGPLVWVCPKGEAAAVCGRYRQSLGPCHFIDPFGKLEKLAYPPWSRLAGKTVAEHLTMQKARMNPMLGLKKPGNDPSDYAGFLAEGFIKQDARNAYFTQGTRQAVVAVMEHLSATVKNASLVDLYNALTLPEDHFQVFMRRVMESSPSQNARKIAADFVGKTIKNKKGEEITKGPPRSLGEIHADIKNQLRDFMMSAGIRDFLGGSNCDFDELKEPGKITTFFIVMPDNAPSRFVRLLYAHLFSALNNPPRTNDVLVIADEIATSLGREGLESFNRAFTVGGGYGLRIQAILQSLEQTQTIWGKETNTILSCCESQQFLKFRDDTTISHILRRAGEYTDSYTATSYGESWGTNERGANEGISINHSRQYYPRPVYFPQDLYEFGANCGANDPAPQLLILGGIGRPVEAFTAPYWHDGLGLRDRADPNPYEPAPVNRPVSPVTLA